MPAGESKDLGQSPPYRWRVLVHRIRPMIHRIDVRPAGADPAGEGVCRQIRELGIDVAQVRSARVYLIDADLDAGAVRRIADELLADPVAEKADLVVAPPADSGASRIEVHLKAGVMDPVAASTEMAIRDMGLAVREVRTARAFLIEPVLPREKLSHIALRVLANGVIESVHFEAHLPTAFAAGHEYKLKLRHVPLRDLEDGPLMKLSREGHLFLSLAEMKAIQAYFRQQGREPTDIELETLAQTWSEHCVHKTLKSAVEVEERDEAGKVVARRKYGNLIKETIFLSTTQLTTRNSQLATSAEGTEARRHEGTKEKAHGLEARATNGGRFCLSVFRDNAGVIAFDETDAVCFKVETHNHPSAIEPYGGSATGVGGVIRDVLGTGLAAKPIANTDVFCVAYPDAGSSIRNRQSAIDNLPKGVIHPKRILQQVVAGVRDYGNRMGIPTVNGAVYFDDNYVGNPLVFCGCVGLIPRDKIDKAARSGDAIVVMGGRTGRDGIHGATFSSAELTDTHADEFSHAVQIGNAITEKKVTDVVLQARDRGLFTAITDCGAGGLSSAVGEMGEKVGAAVNLEKVPLKYAGLRYDEIWISEAQERMVMSVPQEKVKAVLDLAASEDVEATVIGTFGTPDSELILRFSGNEVGRLSMEFLHNGLPMPTRKAVVQKKKERSQEKAEKAPVRSLLPTLHSLLSHPAVASKHWIIRQYDHEVQGGSVIKPLTGPLQVGPSDAAVIRPKLNSHRGVAIGCGLCPQVADPYDMAICAIDEAIRNVVAVGAHPDRMAMLDNFCWPSVEDEITMGTLVRACEACRDAALAYGVPFISGKDSLHNQFTDQETGRVIRIPNTLLISTIGVIEDVRKCVTMDLKEAGNILVLVRTQGGLDLSRLAQTHRRVADAIGRGMVASCHDISEGGALVAAVEMCIASGLGLAIEGLALLDDPFGEGPGGYLLEMNDWHWMHMLADWLKGVAEVSVVGKVIQQPQLQIARDKRIVESASVQQLTDAWRGTLDW